MSCLACCFQGHLKQFAVQKLLTHLKTHASLVPALRSMTAIEKSHREWMEQGRILSMQHALNDAACSLMDSPEPTIGLRSYDPRRLGYSILRHSVAQFERSKTSGGSPPLQNRDVLRSSGSMFFCTDLDGSGLQHAEAKISAFKNKFQQLSVERAFPESYQVKETTIQQRVKTALKDIVKVEESKRSGHRDESAELVQVPDKKALFLGLPLCIPRH
jgi:hypothetical protein